MISGKVACSLPCQGLSTHRVGEEETTGRAARSGTRIPRETWAQNLRRFVGFRAIANSNEKKDARAQAPASQALVAPSIVSPFSPAEPPAMDVQRCLKDLQILFRSQRLYQRNHPRVLESLESAYEQLRSFAFAMNGLALRIERNGIIMPKLSEAALPDVRGELQALAI